MLPNIVKIVLPTQSDSYRFDFVNDVSPWWHIPIEVDDLAVTSIAWSWTLMTQPRAFVEFSKGIWDGANPQFSIANAEGARLRLPGPNRYAQGAEYALVRAFQVFDRLQLVLGSKIGSQFLRVHSIGGNLDVCYEALAAVYVSAEWNPQAQKIDVLATDGSRFDATLVAQRYGIPLIAARGDDGFEITAAGG